MGDRSLPSHALDTRNWSGKRDSNPRPPAWKAGALPLSYSREYARATPSMPERTPVARAAMPRPSFSGHPRSDPGSPYPLQWWGGEDSNPRRRTPADLQSAPFGHLGTSPNPPARTWQPLEKAGAGGWI